MITGHLGVAAAIRGGWRSTSLPWLLAACVAPDLLDVAFAVAGVCNPSGLYSHTVPAALLVGAVIGGAAFLATGSPATGIAAALLVLLHLPPDMITGHKLFWPGGPLIGLRLYDRPWLDFAVELPMALGGWLLLRRSGTAPRWATTGAAAVGLVLIQGAFALAPLDGLKPTACAAARGIVRAE